MALVFADIQPGQGRPHGHHHRQSDARGLSVRTLVAGVKPGTIVRLAAPQGNFVLPDPPPPAMLFITAGSGITPVMSMLRTLIRRDQITDVIHLHSAPTADDAMFGAELTS